MNDGDSSCWLGKIDDDIRKLWQRRKSQWLDCRLSPFEITLPAISSTTEFEAFGPELEDIFGMTDVERCGDRLFVFRGNDESAPLGNPFLKSGYFAEPVEVLREMLATCREFVDEFWKEEDRVCDADLYWLMRHAGLPSPLLDCSRSFYVALWFAIHRHAGKEMYVLRDDANAAVTVVRLSKEGYECENTIEPIPPDPTSRPIVYKRVKVDGNGEFPYERPLAQDSIVIRQRFLPDGIGGRYRLLPLNEDPYCAGRILKIPIVGSYRKINAQILKHLRSERYWRKGWSGRVALRLTKGKSDFYGKLKSVGDGVLKKHLANVSI